MFLVLCLSALVVIIVFLLLCLLALVVFRVFLLAIVVVIVFLVLSPSTLLTQPTKGRGFGGFALDFGGFATRLQAWT